VPPVEEALEMTEILARPEDDAPRLALAAQLEASGQRARAELIRRQCAYAALPAQTTSAERSEAWAPIAALLKEHGATWLGELSLVATERSFWRGFVESASGTAATLLAAADALQRTPMTSLSIEIPDEDSAEADAADREALAQLGSHGLMEQVRSLQFGEGATVDSALRLLTSARWKRLASCSLFDAQGFQKNAAALCEAIPETLRTLSLIGFISTDFDDASAAVLAGSPKLSSLEHLRLWNCNLHEAGAQALARSPHLARLRSLWLGLGQYTLNKIHAAGCAALAEPGALPALEVLDLDFNDVGDAGWLPVVESGKLARFTELRLQKCSLSDASAVPMFAGATRLDALTTLDLSHNQLGASAVRALVEARPAALRKLWLYGNPIGDAGIIALAETPWVQQLEELNVTSTGMTEAGAEVLLRSPHLERVLRLSCDLQKPALEKTTIAALRERFGARLWSPPVTNLRIS
jgi:uncharacterized protein (TIGR02996 family)